MDLESPSASRRSPFTAFEGIYLLALWAASVVSTLALLARPFGSAHHWLTAHVLLSIRGFEQWGFLTLWGASFLAPASLELQHADPASFAKGHGLYLSYPPGAHWLAYAAYKVAAGLGLGAADPTFVAGWTLLSVRLLGLLAAYLVLRELAAIAGAGPRLAMASAMAGAAGWLLVPDVLYYTQETLWTDQAVLPLVTLVLWLGLRARFDATRLSRRACLGYAGLTAAGCFIDWYAWLAAAALALAFVLGTPGGIRGTLRRPWLTLPPVLAGLAFMIQLAHFDHGFGDLLAIAGERVGAVAGAGVAKVSGPWMLYASYVRVFDYVPPAFGLDDKFFLEAVNDRRLPPPRALLGLGALATGVALGLLTAVVRSAERRALALGLLLIAVLPAVQLALLRQHSYVHAFSALKLALPVAALVVTLPVAMLALGGLQPLRAILATVLAATLILPQVLTAPAAAVRAGGHGDSTLAELGRLVAAGVGPGDLPLSDDLLIRAWPSGEWQRGATLEANALGGRLVYDAAYLPYFLPVMKAEDLARMRPVVIYYEDLGPRRYRPWLDPGRPLASGTVGGRHVLVCGASRLRARILDRKRRPTPDRDLLDS